MVAGLTRPGHVLWTFRYSGGMKALNLRGEIVTTN